MEMQDNEFDDLFRSKLDGFEAAPSANVWAGIDAELNSKKRKKILMPFLSIAASIIVLVGAGLFFIPQKQPVNNYHTVKKGGTKATQPVIAMAPGKNDPNASTLKPKPEAGRHITPASAGSIARLIPAKALNSIPVKNTPEIIEQNTQAKTDEQLAIVSTPQELNDSNKAVVPDDSTPLAIKQTADIPATFVPKPVALTAQVPVINNQDTAPVKANHKIHNLAGLLNAVVAKVDKRDDKIIVFGESDDDESNVTGVNLGIIKIKKGE
jgi:hypothetical protein